MQRYFMNIAYMGTRYNGVTQNANIKGHNSIQDVLISALKLFKSVKQMDMYSSSRTDAGVHATNSTLHIDLDQQLPGHVITKKLNTTLEKWNEDIRILKTTPVSNDFDARRDAVSRTYLYRFAVSKEKCPQGVKPKVFLNSMFVPIEESFRCYFILNKGFDIERVKEAAKLMRGVHDFRSFMKVSKEQKTLSPWFCHRKVDIQVQPGNTIATAYNLEKTMATYDFWEIEFKSRAYFYRQIRNMVGVLLAAGNGLLSQRDVYEMLTIPSKHSWSYKASPASSSGLYLTNVEYPEEILAKCRVEIENKNETCQQIIQ